MRSITIDELQGFRDALLELCTKVDLNGYQTMDIVGTRRDGKTPLTFQPFHVLLLQVLDRKWLSMAIMV
jgi:anthranilate phosphoribosyltransferase